MPSFVIPWHGWSEEPVRLRYQLCTSWKPKGQESVNGFVRERSKGEGVEVAEATAPGIHLARMCGEQVANLG